MTVQLTRPSLTPILDPLSIENRHLTLVMAVEGIWLITFPLAAIVSG